LPKTALWSPDRISLHVSSQCISYQRTFTSLISQSSFTELLVDKIKEDQNFSQLLKELRFDENFDSLCSKIKIMKYNSTQDETY
jgi:hypothetical protein